MKLLNLLLLVILAAACTPSSEPAPDEPGTGVFASNYPLAYVAERIAGDHVPITYPVPPDVDPAFWTPTDEEIARLQRADLVLLNGAGYEKWLERISLPTDVQVDTSRSFAAMYLELPVTVTHSHGEAGAHSHAGTDFNTWLDPVLLQEQAQAVLEALTDFAPDQAARFAANAEALFADLAALDQAFGELGIDLDDVANRPLIASHPVYGYLAQRHGWNLEPVLWEPDEMPDDAAWRQLATVLRFHRAKWMVYEDEPLPEIRDRLRKNHGVEVIVFRTCGNRPPAGDYLQEMRAGIERLAAAFAP